MNKYKNVLLLWRHQQSVLLFQNQDIGVYIKLR